MRTLLHLFSVALIVPLLGAAAPTVTQMSPYLHAQRLVDVGGRRLNLYCSGAGSPTVILDAGLGDTTESWYRVQPAIAKQTRVCSYDRAGMGFSDGTMTKRDPDAVVADLHVLLQRAGVRPPYVLVGHSIAGLYEVLYANRYPADVVGMVAVDPSRPFQWQRMLAVAPAMAGLVGRLPQQWQRCYVALAHGTHAANELKPCEFETPHQLAHECATGGPGLCAIATLNDRLAHQPLYWYDQLGELQSLAPAGSGSREVQATQRPYGAMPLIVLTADDEPHHARGFPPTFPRSQLAAEWSVWKTMHDELAAYASAGVNFVVRDTGHYIQKNQPTAVISAITEVIAQARAGHR